MNLKFTNNAAAKLASSISSTSTKLTVESGKGSLFPAITSPQYFYVTLVGDDKMEIVKVTERSTDTFTIVRAQDNTTASAFSAGDVVELRITAAAFNDISTALDELDAFPEQSGNSGKYLTTNGTDVSWASIDTYPSQSGKSGQSLISNGTSTLWHPVAQDVLDAAEAASAESDAEISGTTADSIMASITTLESANFVRSVNGVAADAAGNVTVATPKAYITDSWVSGTSWYRKWSDGWIEQGGEVQSSTDINVTFYKPFASPSSYTLLADDLNFVSTSYIVHVKKNSGTSCTIKVSTASNNTNGILCNWYACGQGV